MLRTLLIAAAAAPISLMPGVTYEDGVQFTPHGAVVMHVIRAPRPGGLTTVEPLLGGGTLPGRETPTALETRLAGQATIAAVNGDRESRRDRGPASLVVRDGVLEHAPVDGRSSAGFDAQGTLHVDRVRFYGTWKGTGQRRPLAGVNEPPAPGQVVLFTSAWGPATPQAADAVDAVLPSFPAARTEVDLSGAVERVARGGGTTIPPDGAVIQARGPQIAAKLTAEAAPGTTVVSRLLLQPNLSQQSWARIVQGIGGGPALVRGGKAVFRSNEPFAPSLLLPRAPRTAIGQTADGTVLLVTVDGGRPGYSVGMTSFELALALQRLGAVTALELGSGAQAAMAFDGALLSRPSAAREQPVADAVGVVYTGVYAPPPETEVFSPNGDGAGETESLAYRLVRPAAVRAVLVGPDGAERVVDEGRRDPAVRSFPFTGADLPEGAWRWRVTATDDAGAASTAERTFSFDRTLGFVQGETRGGGVAVTAQLARPAAVSLEISTTSGAPVRTLDGGTLPAGPIEVVWDGTLAAGRRAHAGRYAATLVARSEIGISPITVAVALPH